jgi:hypothetical protein
LDIKLNLEGTNPALVGLGTYIVNTEGCNDCHSAGPATEYARGGNPFFGQPKKVNAATYLGGGRDFLGVAGLAAPHIISRNLTPTPKTGLPEGDHTFEDFLTIFRTGKDFDGLHANCSATVTTNCFPQNRPPMPSVDGDLLQVMPWPNFKDLTNCWPVSSQIVHTNFCWRLEPSGSACQCHLTTSESQNQDSSFAWEPSLRVRVLLSMRATNRLPSPSNPTRALLGDSS